MADSPQNPALPYPLMAFLADASAGSAQTSRRNLPVPPPWTARRPATRP